MRKAYDKIWEIGHKMGLNTQGSYLIDAAKNYYLMCTTKRLTVKGNLVPLTQGRSLQVVAAVCLYIACRVEKKPYLLIDFSDAIQTNMYELGRNYMTIADRLCLLSIIPLVDPCLFIRRFCNKLEFGKKTD